MSLDGFKSVMADLLKELRPTLEVTAEALGSALLRIPGAPVARAAGPDYWSWEDESGKVFALSPSPEHNGHPLLTIRQPMAKELDTWLTTCSLVIGPDRGSVLSSITLILVNHTGAFAGMESTVRVVSSTGKATDGLAHAIKIAGRDVAENNAIADAIIKGGEGGGVN